MSDRALVHGEDRLHRQVYKTYPDGTAMSVNFVPTPKDEGLLSTRQDAVISAQVAFDEHVAAGLKTEGTWTFTADDTGLDVVDDQHEDGMPTGHASVDFNPLDSRGKRERVGKKIKAAARRTHPLEDR